MKFKQSYLSKITYKSLNVIRVVLTYTSVFILFFFDSAFYPANNFAGTTKLIINIFAITAIVIASGIILKFKKRQLFFYFILISTVTSYGIFYFNIKQTLIISICITVGFVISNFLEYEKFKNTYRNMMLFLAIYSLATLLIWLIFPSVINLLPYALNNSYTYRNAIFSIVSTSTYSTRNIGLFWEPGAFAIFLNVALLFEMTGKKHSLVKILIYAITILTTLSTLGIICLSILIFVYIFQKDREIKHLKRNKIILFLIAFIACIYLVYYNKDFMYHVFGKLSPTDKGDVNVSTSTRINAVIYPFKAFIDSKLLGVGYNDFLNITREYCASMPTCTFLNWLAIYGVLGLPLVIFCIRFFLKTGNNTITKLALFVFSLLLFSTEDFLQIGFVYIFVFYGVESRKKGDTNPKYPSNTGQAL